MARTKAYRDGTSKNLLYVLSAGIIIIALALALVALEPRESMFRNTLDVSGEATLTAEAEEVKLLLTAETEASQAADAQAANARAIESAIGALAAAGVPRNAIETVFFDLQPVREFDEFQRRSVLIGYRATHTLRVRLGDVSEAGEVLDAAVDAGINRVDSIVFDLTDNTKESLRKQAREQASAEARAKADELAASQGTRIVGIAQISESPVIIFPVQRSVAALEAAVATEILPGQVEVRATVSVSYLIG